MCGIAGWFGETPQEVKVGILRNGSIRGRDGWGFKAYDRSQPDQEFRSLEKMSDEEISNISKFSRVVGNFRATPTTEALSRIEILQPYDGIVHNGVIANDKTFGDFPIDSMVLPGLLRNQPFEEIPAILQKIEGSYALAWFEGDSLILACNYKPIYFFTDWKSYFSFGSIPEMLPEYSSALKPYSILRVNIRTFEFETVELPRTQAPGVVVAASSGLDSTAVAYMLKAKGHEVTLAHFQYGCVAESVEVDRIKKIADHGGFKLVFLDLPRVFGGSIVEGHYHQEGIRGTEYAMDWVSARNLLMLSVLTAYAETNNIGTIAFGGNLEESLPGYTKLLLKKDGRTFVETIENLSKWENTIGVKTISVNSDGVCKESDVAKVIVHKCTYDHLLRVTDTLGRTVDLTPCHSIMVRKQEDQSTIKIGSIRTDELTNNSLPYPEIFGEVLKTELLPFPENLDCGVRFSGVTSIEAVPAPPVVYDLSVPGDENFVLANGILVHNSGSYPDNEQEFGRLFNKILPYSTQNGVKITLIDPLSTLMKHEIVKLGNECGTPWELTWSCYSHEEHHCGSCGPCYMRKTAFERNGLEDPVFAHLKPSPSN
jgi:7-cyano-7-deazaguanine synthase in queuosine biosynthesis